MISLMMSQRSKDIGLIRAAGCPSETLFGYFFTELLLIVLLGCLLGVFMALLTDFVISLLPSSISLQMRLTVWNWIEVAATFVLYFIISLAAGTKTIIDTSRMSPIQALSPEHRFGASEKAEFKIVSNRNIIFATSLRSLIRRRNVTVKMLLCLSLVFTLVTIGIAGGVIGRQTTQTWIERAVGNGIVLIGHEEMCQQYSLLLKQFYDGGELPQFNYTDKKYIVPEDLIARAISFCGSSNVEERIVVQTEVHEIQGYIVGETSQATQTVGDNRKGQTLVVGVNPNQTFGRWYLDGRQLGLNQSTETLVGDTLSRRLFSQPLVQKMRLFDSDFNVVGVCIDPINNGNVSYVQYDLLRTIIKASGPNVLLVKSGLSTSSQSWLQQLNTTVKADRPDFSVLDLNIFLDKSIHLIENLWSTVIILPLLSLFAVSLCLVGYVALSIDEQSHEYAVMRAIGARPRTIFRMVFSQSLLVLLPSYGIGMAIGVMITLMILVRGPVVTMSTVLEIAGWQALALTVITLSSFIPALRFARKPLVEILRKV
jgi:ABC-type antimicrobial peptide transport system permease subunit